MTAEPMCPLDDTLPAAWCSHCRGFVDEQPRRRGDRREGLLLNDPSLENGVMRPGAELPEVRWLSIEETIREIENLIDSGGWSSGEKGLKDWGVAQRLGTVQYPCVHDALHTMNKRGHRVHTRSIFWYVGG